MHGKWLRRWVGTATLAALASGLGCCSFWERHCGYQQHTECAPCCCPCQTTGYTPVTPVASPTWTPTNGCRCP